MLCTPLNPMYTKQNMNLKRRQFLSQASLGLAALSLGACASNPAPARTRTGPDAIVDAGFTGKPGSLVDGKPVFRSIAEALEDAASGSQILIRAGRYEEKLNIFQSGIHLIGEDRDRTILSFAAYAGQTRPGGAGTWGTAGSATLTVLARDFTAENLCIENAFDYPANLAKGSTDPTYIRNAQAVAVYIADAADRSLFRNVKLTGYQDTLFAHAGRALFENCFINGNVDFIFGSGQAWFEACEISVRGGGRKQNPIGWLTAPSTPISKKYGFVFNRCRMAREADVPDASVRLGRPWHPSGDPDAIGQSVFIDCWMDAHIAGEGWDSMSSTTKSGSKVTFLPEDSRFFEYRSTGPGAAINPQRRQLDEARRADFTRDKVLAGWAG